jgi:hypothetical protein
MMSQLPHPLWQTALVALAAGAAVAAPTAAASQPVQVAVAAPPAARAKATLPAPPTPAEAKTLATDFVRSYAASTRFHTIGRWAGSLCVNVVGLSLQQVEAVHDRIAEVADSVGLTVLGPACKGYNVEIAFAKDPQGTLESVKAHGVNPLGDRTSETRDVKTVTLPIQAWYVTNGVVYADNDTNSTNSLKVSVLYQGLPPAGAPPGVPSGSAFNPSPGTGVGNGFPAGGGGGYGGEGPRAFVNVLVIVDARRTANVEIGALADYVAMLALSQPRALGQCNVLPSITDLFANCPGRAPPNGLTPADTAYLAALYTAAGAVIGESQQSHVVQRMADLMIDPKVADRDLEIGKAVAKGAECAAALSTIDKALAGCRADRIR